MKKIYITAFMAAFVLTACSNTTPVDVNTTTPITTTMKTESPSQTETSSQTIENPTTTETLSVPSGFLFSPSEQVTLYIQQEATAVLSQLGEPLTLLEAPSCAFQGMDRIYGFGSYEITTYENHGKEYIYDIYFLDDSITTEEGIYIGCSKAEMEACYGTNYIETAGSYIYTKDKMTLQFLINKDTITSIRYHSTEV